MADPIIESSSIVDFNRTLNNVADTTTITSTSSLDSFLMSSESYTSQNTTPRSKKDKDKSKMDYSSNGSQSISDSSSPSKYSPLSLISPRKKQVTATLSTQSPSLRQTVSAHDLLSTTPSDDTTLSSSSSSSITASISDSSLIQYHALPSDDTPSSMTSPSSSTSVLDDTPSSSNSTPSVTSPPPTSSTTSTPSSGDPLGNPAQKKRFFSFFSRNKAKPIIIPEKPSTSSITSPSITSPSILATSTKHSSTATNNTASLPTMHHPMHHLHHHPMSTSLDGMSKTLFPQPSPISFTISSYSPIASPAPSPLKTSIIRSKASRGTSFASVAGKRHLSSSDSMTLLLPPMSAPLAPTTNPSPHTSSSYIGNMAPPGSIGSDATWLMIVSNWEEWSEPHMRALLTKYVYQGIPERFRPTMWYRLSNMIAQVATVPTCADLALTHRGALTPLSTPSNQTPVSTPLFKSQSASSLSYNMPPSTISGDGPSTGSPLTTSISSSGGTGKSHKCFYTSILKHPSEHEEQIDVDIQRTFADLVEPQRSTCSAQLFNVLKAISLFDTEMGYCQGISFIGSILITRVQEEEAFHILVRLLEGVMRDFYIIGMRGLKLRLYQMSKLVKELFPELHKHLERIDLDYTIFASPWFMTAFSYHLSEECCVRILDVILLEGIEAFFSVGLAIFQVIQADLLDCTDSSQVMEYFRCNAKEKIDVTTLMDTAARISVSSRQLATFAAQFDAEQKPSFPTEFNPDAEPRAKVQDPNWVVKKYKLKEYIANLEEDLALMKHELHYHSKKAEEEKYELVKHLQELSERESHLIELKRASDLNYSSLLRENEELKQKLFKSEECNNFLADEMRVLRSKVEKELWNNNPKNSIKWS
eukprot:gene16678-19820_t